MKISTQQNYNSYYFKICIAVTSLTALVVGILSLSNLDALESVGTTGGGSIIGLGVIGLSICIYFSKKNNTQTNSKLKAVPKVIKIASLDDKVKIEGGISSFREIQDFLENGQSARVFISDQTYYCFKNGESLELHLKNKSRKSNTYDLAYNQGKMCGFSIN